MAGREIAFIAFSASVNIRVELKLRLSLVKLLYSAEANDCNPFPTEYLLIKVKKIKYEGESCERSSPPFHEDQCEYLRAKTALSSEQVALCTVVISRAGLSYHEGKPIHCSVGLLNKQCSVG